LTNGSQSFTARAAHSVIYSEKTDELYMFGGFDLNRILGDMEIYKFKESRWVDSNGKLLKVDVSS
jgi:hypothetical protein